MEGITYTEDWEYRGFKGSAVYLFKYNIWYGKILNQPFLISYSGETLQGLKKEFMFTVDQIKEPRSDRNLYQEIASGLEELREERLCTNNSVLK